MAERAAASGGTPTARRGGLTRPWTVNFALILLGIVVVALLAGAAHSLEATIRVMRLLPQAAESTGAPQSELTAERTTTAAIGFALTAVQAVIAAVLAALTVWVGRGHQAARIMLAAVAVLLSMCCAGGSTIPSRSTGDSSELAFTTEVGRLTVATQPRWESALELPARAVAIVLPLVTLALLLMPASNRFFRRPRGAKLPPNRQSVG
ncbi:hypothetical protein [Micromonospora chersina]|uniref:hypothetical protein n=1 Tax=Micromonospora chersina TaxID=47854 RepID=UPI00372321F9